MPQGLLHIEVIDIHHRGVVPTLLEAVNTLGVSCYTAKGVIVHPTEFFLHPHERKGTTLY